MTDFIKIPDARSTLDDYSNSGNLRKDVLSMKNVLSMKKVPKKFDFGKAAAALEGGAQLATGAMSLAQPSGKGLYEDLKSQARAMNNMRINTLNLDEIDQVQRGFQRMRDDYGWKDFYACGGPLSHRYDAGGRMAMGVAGNTASGAAAGASVGGLWGGIIGGVLGLGSGLFGAFTGKSKAKKMANTINDWAEEANTGMNYKVASAADNARLQEAYALANSNPYALGGPLETLAEGGIGALGYDLMSDYLTMRNNQAMAKGNTVTYLGSMPDNGQTATRGWKHGKGGLLNEYADSGDTFFALGGDIQGNSSDFSTGLAHIDAGGTHERNPYHGVRMGIARDGQPNLVEEDETIYDNYVFSNRLKPGKGVLRKFKIYGKGGKLSYADVSKRLEKEAAERPNDPISRKSLEQALHKLMEAQEQQKAEEREKELMKYLASLSPEEQQQLLAQMTQQPMEGQPAMEQPIEEQPATVQPGEEALMGAYGGELGHIYDDGGWKNQLADYLGLHSPSAWKDFAKKHGMEDFDISNYADDVEGYEEWQKSQYYKKLMDAIGKDSPALAHALNNGYSFFPKEEEKPGYAWDDLYKAMEGYNRSLGKGKNSSLYAIDDASKPFIYGLGEFESLKKMEEDERYKDFTNNVLKVINGKPTWRVDEDGNIIGVNEYTVPYIKYLQTYAGRVPEETNIGNMIVKDSDGNYSFNNNAATWYEKARYDGLGGAGHYTPVMKEVKPVIANYMVNGENVEDYLGTPSGKPVNTYSWVDEKGIRHTNNYYGTPVVEDDKGDTEGGENKIPYDKKEVLRYAAPIGSLTGLGMWGLGIGKPELGAYSSLMDYANQMNGTADVAYIGNKRRYTPKDVNAPLNEILASSRGTDRALVNNGTSFGGKAEGLLANGYNTLLAMAKNQGSVDALNEAQKKDVFDDNQKTDMFNAESYNKASMANAEMRNNAAKLKAELMGNIIQQRENARSGWYNSLYKGVSGLFENLYNMGEEASRHNRLAGLANDGIFRVLSEDAPYYMMGKDPSAKGRKKKGLII